MENKNKMTKSKEDESFISPSKIKFSVENVITIITALLAVVCVYYELNSRVDVLEQGDVFQQLIMEEQSKVIKENTNAYHKLDKTLAVLIGKLNLIIPEEVR